jgi:hypothetical protein
MGRLLLHVPPALETATRGARRLFIPIGPVAARLRPFGDQRILERQGRSKWRRIEMRKLMLAAAIGLLGVTGASALATAETRQTETYVCLDTGGQNRGPICDRTLNNSSDDFCRCPGNTDKVKIAVCQPGQIPPSQSAAYEAAAHRLSSDGSLMGDEFDGQAICARDTVNGRAR